MRCGASCETLKKNPGAKTSGSRVCNYMCNCQFLTLAEINTHHLAPLSNDLLKLCHFTNSPRFSILIFLSFKTKNLQNKMFLKKRFLFFFFFYHAAPRFISASLLTVLTGCCHLNVRGKFANCLPTN